MKAVVAVFVVLCIAQSVASVADYAPAVASAMASARKAVSRADEHITAHHVHSAFRSLSRPRHFQTQGFNAGCAMKFGLMVDAMLNCTSNYSISDLLTAPTPLLVDGFCNQTCQKIFVMAAKDFQTTCKFGDNDNVMIDLRTLIYAFSAPCATATPGGPRCFLSFMLAISQIEKLEKNQSATAIGYEQICNPCFFKIINLLGDYAGGAVGRGELTTLFMASNAICMRENGTFCLRELEMANAMRPPDATALDLFDLGKRCRTRCVPRILSMITRGKMAELMDEQSKTAPNQTVIGALRMELGKLNAGRAVYVFECSRNGRMFCFQNFALLQDAIANRLPVSIPGGRCASCQVPDFVTNCINIVSSGGTVCSSACMTSLMAEFVRPMGCCFGTLRRFFLNPIISDNIPADQLQTVGSIIKFLNCTALPGLNQNGQAIFSPPCVGPKVKATLALKNLRYDFLNGRAAALRDQIADDVAAFLALDKTNVSVTFTSRTAVGTAPMATNLNLECGAESTYEGLSIQTAFADKSNGVLPLPSLAGQEPSESQVEPGSEQGSLAIDSDASSVDCPAGNCGEYVDPPSSSSSSSTGKKNAGSRVSFSSAAFFLVAALFFLA